MDPEILRLREGATLNRGLLAFGNCIRALSNPSTAELVNYGESMLTQILAQALGGNSYLLVVACLRQGDWELNKNTMRHVAELQQV
ncbi:hypothetical protein CYMTET_33531 [Cymbomonas tetramitiformis]|uniref:Kinesin motor domain-containing protein n=1 Tax=Cymbomonas tetramitiformis TaxID=36881 RepID=A0AAE0FCV3_9CHLO|nr:hypothetical protein CYMTET_33531 [Cymbomonas tetramitiformis]